MAYVSEWEDRQQLDWQCPTCRLAARAREGCVILPNNPLIVAALQAICAGGPQAKSLEAGWRRNQSGAPIYEFWNGAGGRIVVSVDTHDDDAWSDIESYSTLTLDVAIALLGALAGDPFRQATSAPRREPVWLGAPVVLNAKSYRRFGAERSAFGAAVAAEMDKLERLQFSILAYPAFDPRTRKWREQGITRSDVRLLEAAPEIDAFAPANDRSACPHARPLRFGAWAEHWLNGAGLLWTAPLPQSILQLDHRENRSADALAKRIAVMLTLSLAAARSDAPLRMPMRALLRRVGMLPRLDIARPAHSGRLADRVEEALMRLSERSLLSITIQSDKARHLRAANRRWFEEWLDGAVEIQRWSRPNAADD